MNHSAKFFVFSFILLILFLGKVRAQVPIPTEYVSVGDYTGTANEKITAAIAAAMATDHKTVFFPNGSYALRSTLQLNQGTNTELHLIGESRDGVFLVPDIPYLEANYNGGDWQNGGARLATMINLSGPVFDSVDVSLQNMTIDMRSQQVMGDPVTYNVIGHGVRVGQGWMAGQFTVNHVTIRNAQGYGVGIQDRDGHPKNNITLSNLLIERTGSDGVDTKEASGDGNRNLVIRNVSINEVGFIDPGAAPALDLRYRDVTIDNVNIVTRASRSTLPGQTSNVSGINFRPWDNGPGTGIAGATVSNVYVRGGTVGIRIHSDDTAPTPHANIAISDFRIQGQRGAGIDILGTSHSGHTISNGFVDPAFGGAAVAANGQAVVTNVSASRWDPALTPLTETTFESNVSLADDTYSPAWIGMVGSERVGINPTAPGAGPFVFDVGDTGIMQIDYDGAYNAMDKLIVDGTLNLDGQLLIDTIDGVPSTAGTYQIFEADAITGSFDSITLPPVTGLIWVTDNLATDGTIRLVEVPAPLISPVNTDSHVVASQLGNASTSFSFDAGAEADMLLVAVSSEHSNETSPILSYGGNAMTPAVEEVQAGIWSLDLTETSYQGGAVDLVIDFTGISAVNGVAMGVVSISSSGRTIKLHAPATGTESAELVTTRDDAFVLASFNANGSGSPSVNAPLTPIYANGNIGSAQGAAGFQIADAGTHPITWTTGNKRRVTAAAFVVANTFANRMADYALGTAVRLGDDPEGDGLPNGVEAWFGSHPGEFSRGLAHVAMAGADITFTHPVSSMIPDDLEGFYQWSMNLVDWYASDGLDGPATGEKVSASSQVDVGTATVTMSPSESLPHLFLRAAVRAIE